MPMIGVTRTPLYPWLVGPVSPSRPIHRVARGSGCRGRARGHARGSAGCRTRRGYASLPCCSSRPLRGPFGGRGRASSSTRCSCWRSSTSRAGLTSSTSPSARGGALEYTTLFDPLRMDARALHAGDSRPRETVAGDRPSREAGAADHRREQHPYQPAPRPAASDRDTPNVLWSLPPPRSAPRRTTLAVFALAAGAAAAAGASKVPIRPGNRSAAIAGDEHHSWVWVDDRVKLAVGVHAADL